MNEMTLGSEFATAPYRLDDACAQAYERAVKAPRRRRRRINIHTDRNAAAKAGFVAPIAAGEHTIAVALELIVDNFGERFLRDGSFDVALVKPVLFGDTLTAHARVARVEPEKLELDVWVENQEGAQVLIGKARVRAARQ